MVKKLSVFLLLLAPLMALHFDAEAGRLGGGRTIGRSYNAPSRPAEVARPSAPTSQPGAVAKPRPAWQGILGGALLGLGLGALFSSLGMGSMMGGILSTLLMVGLAFFAIMFLMRFLNRRKEAQAGPYAYNQAEPTSPPTAPAQAYSAPPVTSGTPEIGSGLGQTASSSSAPESDWTIPADFDQVAFLRQAKTQFIRLQAAWDKSDLNDLREFTTNEMFAEIKIDLQDRGNAVNVTEVITVEARLLGIRTTDIEYVASVQLTGTIKEALNAPTNGFSEVWYMSKGKTSGGWLLAGIEQR